MSPNERKVRPAHTRHGGGGGGPAGFRLGSRLGSHLGRGLALVLLAVVATGCRSLGPPGAGAPGRPGEPVERGTASWYGAEFDGRPTASGERFDAHALTAAHRSLAFGTVIEVRDLDNGRSVRVRVNDRGPFKRHRIIDLSYAAAKELGMLGPGTARVELVVLGLSPPPEPLTFTVQVAAFGDAGRAEALSQQLTPLYPEVEVRSDGAWHRVQIGSFGERSAAERLRQKLVELGFAALVVALPPM